MYFFDHVWFKKCLKQSCEKYIRGTKLEVHGLSYNEKRSNKHTDDWIFFISMLHPIKIYLLFNTYNLVKFKKGRVLDTCSI